MSTPPPPTSTNRSCTHEPDSIRTANARVRRPRADGLGRGVDSERRRLGAGHARRRRRRRRSCRACACPSEDGDGEWRLDGVGSALIVAPAGEVVDVQAAGRASSGFDQLCRVTGRFEPGRRRARGRLPRRCGPRGPGDSIWRRARVGARRVDLVRARRGLCPDGVPGAQGQAPRRRRRSPPRCSARRPPRRSRTRACRPPTTPADGRSAPASSCGSPPKARTSSSIPRRAVRRGGGRPDRDRGRRARPARRAVPLAQPRARRRRDVHPGPPAMSRVEAVISDFGGVLTSPLLESFASA